MRRLRRLIRKGTLEMAFIPVLAGSAFKNKGVQPLLNAVIDYLPGPLDVERLHGLQTAGDEEETRNIARRPTTPSRSPALAFKIMNDPFVGSLTFTRIYSGKMKQGHADPELDQGQARARRAHDDDARERPRGDR